MLGLEFPEGYWATASPERPHRRTRAVLARVDVFFTGSSFARSSAQCRPVCCLDRRGENLPPLSLAGKGRPFLAIPARFLFFFGGGRSCAQWAAWPRSGSQPSPSANPPPA